MRIINIDELPQQATPLGGKARILAENPHLKLVKLHVEAGQRVDNHSAPVDVLFIVLEGMGRITVDSETEQVAAGQLLICPADAERSIEAAVGSSLDILVARCPNL